MGVAKAQIAKGLNKSVREIVIESKIEKCTECPAEWNSQNNKLLRSQCLRKESE